MRDRSPGAYEKLIDRLLGSPHFGERWARHWVDVAGYSDILGADNDAALPPAKIGENKWRYRDYVIRSFNEDKPYDRFLVEQIAGDEGVTNSGVRPRGSRLKCRKSWAATGFLRCAPDDTDQYELNTADLRYTALHHTTQTVLSNVLGLTVGCAQCHSHKYDPIPQRDSPPPLPSSAPAFNPQSRPFSRKIAVPGSAVERAEIDRHNSEINRQLEPFKKRLARIRQPHEE